MRALLILLFCCCSIYLNAQEVKKINYAQLEELMSPKDDTLYVVNFWATWCKPCIEELPFFERLADSYTSNHVKVLLVSLDFIDKIEDRLIPFIIKNKVKSEVVILDAPNENEWIPKISPEWSGSIPATLFIQGNKRLFFEKSFTEESLNNTIKQFFEKH